MAKTLLLAATLLVLTATTSFAQRGGLSLGWGNCRVNGAGAQNATSACTTNSGNGPLLVGAFIPNASSNLNSLNSAFLYIDVFSSGGAALPPWWTFTDPPVTGCRALNVWSLDMANNASATCDRSYWGEVGSPSSASRWFYPTYAGGHGTLRLLVAVDAQIAAATPQIGAGEESHILGARLGRQNSTGAGSCFGCLEPMNLYFAQADFFQTNGDNFVIGGVGTSGIPFNNERCATFNGISPAEACAIGDAVRNGSWGAIKSMYR